jgi:hypothetical protein
VLLTRIGAQFSQRKSSFQIGFFGRAIVSVVLDMKDADIGKLRDYLELFYATQYYQVAIVGFELCVKMSKPKSWCGL